jgi:hypothetical protein
VAGVTSTLTGTGGGTAVGLRGSLNASASGGAGTVQIERSFDGGATWHTVYIATTLLSWALNGNAASIVLNEPEDQVKYRWNCTAYTSGSLVCRLGQ